LLSTASTRVATSPINDPSALSGVLTGVSFVGGLATGLSLADAPFPQPGADVKDIQKFFQGSSGAERINAAGQLLSAASLAVFSRSVAQLAGRADPSCSRPLPSPVAHSPSPRWPPPRQPPPHSHRSAVMTTIRPGHDIGVDLGLLAGALVEASEIRPQRNDQCAHRVQVACTARAGRRLHLARGRRYRPEEGTRPWRTRTSRQDASDKRRAPGPPFDEEA
jgi:hypothetical protein